MKVWLIKIGEPLPIEGAGVRLLRVGLLFNKLSSSGHNVLWWSSTFSHSAKRHLFVEDKKIKYSDHSSIHLINSIGYHKNISLRRVIDHVEVASKFRHLSLKEPTPDVIFCAMPTLDLSLAAVKYGCKHQVPVVIDMRDMWPDIFVSRAPAMFQKILRKILIYPFYQIRTVCKEASAITGITQGYVDWGLQYAEREKTSFDRDFPMGYSADTPDLDEIKAAEAFWSEQGINPRENQFIVCLFSNIVKQLELETVIDAARRLEKTGRHFRFVFCGRGDALEYFKNYASGCKTVSFPGWVDKSQIWVLLRLAHAGVAPYKSTEDFLISIPNKAIEYMSAGLPIVSSLKGTLQELLAKHEIGVTYENNNIDSLFNLLCNLYDNPHELTIMSNNSNSLFKARFSAENVYSDMCAYLEEVVNTYKIRQNQS
jgi:glycosyltransferase involved in cell wall biosynthesis